MKARLMLFAVAATVVSLSAPALLRAHHAFSAEFDMNKKVKLEGTLVKMEWVNPHCWLHIDVKKPNGTVENWMIEGGAPNTLLRRGFTKTTLPVGAKVLVEGYLALDGGRRVNGRTLTFADGRKLFMGSSGTGAPRDGRDSSER